LKEDADTVIGEAAEATGIGLDGLDAGVEALGERVGHWVGEVVEQAEKMGFEAAGGLFEWREFTVGDGVVPLSRNDSVGLKSGVDSWAEIR